MDNTELAALKESLAPRKIAADDSGAGETGSAC